MLTLQQKMEILNKLENGMTPMQLADEYHTADTTIRRVRQHAKALKCYAEKGSHLLNRRHRREPLYSHVETRVYQWFLERKAEGDRLTDALLQQKALEVNSECGGPSTFNASRGWVSKFKARNNIRSFRMDEEEAGIEEEITDRLICNFTSTVKKEPVEYCNKEGSDERILTWEVVPSKGLEEEEFESPAIQHALQNGIELPKQEKVCVKQEVEEQKKQGEQHEEERKQEQKEQQRQEQDKVTKSKEQKDNVKDVKRKELEEALKTIKKYVTNKTVLKLAQSLIYDIIEEDV